MGMLLQSLSTAVCMKHLLLFSSVWNARGFPLQLPDFAEPLIRTLLVQNWFLGQFIATMNAIHNLRYPTAFGHSRSWNVLEPPSLLCPIENIGHLLLNLVQPCPVGIKQIKTPICVQSLLASLSCQVTKDLEPILETPPDTPVAHPVVQVQLDALPPPFSLHCDGPECTLVAPFAKAELAVGSQFQAEEFLVLCRNHF